MIDQEIIRLEKDDDVFPNHLISLKSNWETHALDCEDVLKEREYPS